MCRSMLSIASSWHHGAVHAKSLLLADTASLFFRAFHGLPVSLTAPDGRPVNAVRGLLDFLARFVDQYRPTHLACCWDESWRPAWRVALLPQYKAHRVAHGDVEQVPQELTAQVPLIRAVLARLGLAVVGAPGFEADDVIGTLAARSDLPVDVVTGDRDLFQLVDDSRRIRVLSVVRGVARHEQVTDAWLQSRYGIPGAGYADFATLRGDPSDGLPGVPGIGEKTAARLVADYHSLEGILAAAADGRISGAIAARLSGAIDYLAAAREVVGVRTDVPLAVTPDELRLPVAPVDPAGFAELSGLLNLGGSAQRIVEALARAYA